MSSTQVNRITEISQTVFGSEDDLIYKVVLPFFQVMGYGSDSVELKFPVHGYRPNRPGRKPEADCVFFSRSPHDVNSSLLVVEIKREDAELPEQQARFYSTNLFVPFYVAWSGIEFEVWQVQNFRQPSLIGRYRLDRITALELSELLESLSPNKVLRYSEENEIKKFDLDDRRKMIEARYLSRLAEDLRTFKALDLPQIRDLDIHFVELRLQALGVVARRTLEDRVLEGQHPEAIASNAESGRTAEISDLLDRTFPLAIIGDPGTGKTTLLRHLCLENAYSDSRLLPIFVSVRELVATDETLVECVLRQIRRYGDTDNPRYLFEAALAKGRILLCVDGVDELGLDEPKDARDTIVRFSAELSEILNRGDGNRVVITARRESWPVCRPLLPQSLHEFEVLPFTQRAVRIFVSKWFAESPEHSDQIIDSLRARGWPSYAKNPLLLTLMCASIPIQGEVPKQASELYGRFLSFMLEKWNTTRRISERPPVPNLDTDAVILILGELALEFHLQRRAAFTRAEIIGLLATHLNALGARHPTSQDVFLELTKQHGMLRSWSVDQYYAFPHLSFQAYLTAKALRLNADGSQVVFEHRHDAFWHEAVLLYAGLGDISGLSREILATPDNILHSELLLLAECWAAGGTITDTTLSEDILERLVALANGKTTYLSDRAIDILARISAADARATLAGMIKDPNGQFMSGRASRFAFSVFGAAILPGIVEQLKRTGHDDDLLENFSLLPRRAAIQQLRDLILNTSWPTKEDTGHDPGIRHIRRGAARLMSTVGEDLALGPLQELISSPILSDFEKSGCVSALASIDDPSVTQVLRRIVGGNFPMDCRIKAAGNLAPDEPDARRFLLAVVADETQDYFDRRDAAGELQEFIGITDDDLSFFRPLIFDPSPQFVGGPDVAIGSVGKIGTNASRALLQEALEFWKKSDYPQAYMVRNAVLQALSLEDTAADLREILERAGRDHWINLELPTVALEYIRREPVKAYDLFTSALDSYDRKEVYAGTLAWAVLVTLPQIALTDQLLKAAIDLAKRLPGSSPPWSAISKVWQRRDISSSQRGLFELRP